MMDEFAVDDLEPLSDFIIDISREATRGAIARIPSSRYGNTTQVDGYDAPVHMEAALEVQDERLAADLTGTSGMSCRGINCPEVYTRAYACSGLKCAIAPAMPNNTGSLEPFEITTPEGCILAARRPAPVSVRHVLGHFVPDVVPGALHQVLPGRVLAERASALWNVQISAQPTDPASGCPNREVLAFNSGGTGARPARDGLSATTFSSGVSTMSVETTEHAGPITV